VEGKNAPKLEMVDQYTLKFSYTKPMFYFINTIASVPEAAWPKHYMKQFHPKYNKDATWEIFTKNVDWWVGRGKVVMQGWMLDEFQAGKFLKMIRNPYYFKVDTSGNQLPYLDRVTWTVIEDRPTIALKCVAGEIDLDGMWVGIPQIPLFFEEKPKRGFDLGWYENVGAWSMYPNMDHPDAVVRAALRDINFRKAISLAINRKEINKTFYFDLVDISNNCFAANNPGYDKALTTLFSEFNPTEANKLLDTAGYKDTNNDKVRESPDGKPLALVIDVYQHDLYVPLMEMVIEQLKAVGIKATLNIQQQDAIFARLNAFEFQLTVGDFRGANLVLDSLGDFIPISDTTPWWHNKASKEPFSPEFKKFADLLGSAKTLPFDKMVDTIKQANKIYTENVFSWSVGSMKRPYYIGKGVYNVPKASSRLPADTPPLMLYQVYIKR
jgi:peptide/nickel transport system substrate-binding protein